MTGHLTLETRTEMGRLLFEAQICAEAAFMGIESLARAASEVRDTVKLNAALKLLTQAADALEELHRVLEPVLAPEGGLLS